MMKNKQNATNKNQTQDRHRGGLRNQLSNNFFVIYFQLNLYIYIFQNFQKLLHLLFFFKKAEGSIDPPCPYMAPPLVEGASTASTL